MNKNRIWLALLAVGVAAEVGCGTTDPFVPKTPMLEKIDKRLLTRCDSLPENVVLADEEALIKQKGTEATLYSTCSKRHDALATQIEKLNLGDAFVDPGKAKAEKDQ